LTGGLSALWIATNLTPFAVSKWHYVLQLMWLPVCALMRGPLFAMLLVAMIRECYDAGLWFLLLSSSLFDVVSTLGASSLRIGASAALHCMMLWFNHAFMQTLWKRVEQVHWQIALCFSSFCIDGIGGGAETSLL
jgi:hypothetical protein